MHRVVTDWIRCFLRTKRKVDVNVGMVAIQERLMMTSGQLFGLHITKIYADAGSEFFEIASQFDSEWPFYKNGTIRVIPSSVSSRQGIEQFNKQLSALYFNKIITKFPEFKDLKSLKKTLCRKVKKKLKLKNEERYSDIIGSQALLDLCASIHNGGKSLYFGQKHLLTDHKKGRYELPTRISMITNQQIDEVRSELDFSRLSFQHPHIKPNSFEGKAANDYQEKLQKLVVISSRHFQVFKENMKNYTNMLTSGKQEREKQDTKKTKNKDH